MIYFMETYQNNKTIIGFLFGLIVLGGLVYLTLSYLHIKTPEQPPVTIPPNGPITVRGYIVCLPHRDTTGPQTLECAFGLRDKSGNYFALRDTDPSYQNIVGMPTNTQVDVEGIFSAEINEKYQGLGTIAVTKIQTAETSWQISIPSEQGMRFAYPPSLETTYIQTTDWPPSIMLYDNAFTCTPAGSETARAGKTEERFINGRPYCVTTIQEGAAGSVYTQYAYAFPRDGKTAIFTFSLRNVQCANYPEPEKTACEAEQQSFTIDTVVDRMAERIQTN